MESTLLFSNTHQEVSSSWGSGSSHPKHGSQILDRCRAADGSVELLNVFLGFTFIEGDVPCRIEHLAQPSRRYVDRLLSCKRRVLLHVNLPQFTLLHIALFGLLRKGRRQAQPMCGFSARKSGLELSLFLDLRPSAAMLGECLCLSTSACRRDTF